MSTGSHPMIERLRGEATLIERGGIPFQVHLPPLLTEAADEIERLRDELREALRQSAQRIEERSAEVHTLKEELAAMTKRAEMAEEEWGKWDQRSRKLEAALDWIADHSNDPHVVQKAEQERSF